MRVRVDFLDDEHEELIKNNNPILHNAIIKKNHLLNLNLSEFLIYGVYMYQDKRLGRVLYEDMARDMPKKWSAFEEYLKTGETINTAVQNTDRKEVPEFLGVAGALTVFSALNNMTQADWKKLPATSKHKDLDFSGFDIDGQFITIEAKGAFVANNREAIGIINDRQSSIDEKKVDETVKKRTSEKGGYNIGAIVLVDPCNPLRVILSDPKLNFSGDGRRIAIMKRLHFVLSEMTQISSLSRFTVALRNRMSVMDIIENIDSIDEMALVNSYNENIGKNIKEGRTSALVNGNLFKGRYIISGKYIYFVGLSLELLKTVSDMKFEAILEFKQIAESSSGKVSFKIKKRDFHLLPNSARFNIDTDEDIKLQKITTVYLGSSGIAISRNRLNDFI